MKNVGIKLKSIRKELKLTREKLSNLTKVSVKTIYNLESGRVKPQIETLIKIRNALKENFDLDFFERLGIKLIWRLEDLDQEALSIIEGNLLGDGCIAKYSVFTQAAKDKNYLGWLSRLLNKKGAKCKIIPIRSKTGFSSSKSYWLYSHKCPAFSALRHKWYQKNKDKVIKRVPKDLKISPTVLLHWYLGDGDFKRDKRIRKNGRPCVRLSTNAFLREDIELLIKKLKKVGLNFYSVPNLTEKKEKDYILYLRVSDTLKFFKLVGIEPIEEIKNCVTKIVKNRKIYTFKDKWPTKSDWIKILTKSQGIGKLLKEGRRNLSLSQRELAEKLDVKKHHISEIECGRKYPSLKRFRRFLDILKLDIYYILNRLTTW